MLLLRTAMFRRELPYTGFVLGSLAVYGAGAALAVGGYFYAGMWPESQIFGRTLIAGNDPDEIALTFDDGPNDAYTEQLLDLLARNEALATFFLIGRFARQRPELVRQIRDAGHTIGNHTWTHPRLMFSSPERVRQELSTTNAAIEDILGEKIRYFRPPHGSRRPAVLRIARELELVPVLWNVTVFDWNTSPSQELLQRMERGIHRNRRRGRGSNLLLHDGGDTRIGVDRSRTIGAVASLLEQWGGRGRFVTIAEWEHPKPSIEAPGSKISV